MRLAYNLGVRTLFFVLALASFAVAQTETTPPPSNQPQVRVNIINVCTPNDADKQLLADALAHLPARGGFSQDLEIARGRTVVPDQALADWVRVRREFPAGSPYTSVQYTFSKDTEEQFETLVFHLRDPKDVLTVSISDRMTAAVTPAAALATDTPASHVKVERSAKPSVALARCQQADQSGYEPLFQSASTILAHYRDLLGVRTLVPGDLSRLGTSGHSSGKKKGSKPASPSSPPASTKP